MQGTLYRYPHPHDASRFIYVGQGPKRDKDHRAGRSSFGRRFKRDFPDIELPQPVREVIEVSGQLELNELETIWMFQFHTWHGYEDGMNKVIPGGQFGAALIGGFATNATTNGRKGNGGRTGAGARACFEKGVGIHGRSLKQRAEDASKGGKVGGAINVRSGHLSRIQKSAAPLGGRVAGRLTAERGTGCHRPELQNLGRHNRWHVNRNVVKTDCGLCQLAQAA
jgi:hypothetical protein